MPASPLAVVTGASSGIGETFARKLAARGYRLLLVARRRDLLERLARELNGEALVADLADEAQVGMLEERLRTDPQVELLVNNAGFGTVGLFFDLDVEANLRMHRVHVLATMRLTHAALRGMTARGHGAVINVSSVAGFMRSPGNVSYCSTKAWMNAFTQCLDLELKSTGSAVKVQALCPGFTHSSFHETAGMDSTRIPKSLWLNADHVVEESLRGLDRGALFVVPGWRYKLLLKALPLLPYALMRAGALRYARRMGRA